MCDQIKIVWKSLLCGICCFFANADSRVDDSLDVVRVSEGDKRQVLETAVRSYEKGGKVLDLVGVVHLGEREYYDALNELLTGYDLVFYEMIGEGKPAKPVRNKKPAESVGDLDSEMAVLSRMYRLYHSMLALELQSAYIDYHRDNFVHADMTYAEFTALQEERGERIMDFAFENIDLFSDVNQNVILSAMLSGDGTALKKSLMGVLAKVDDRVGRKEDESVLIRARNEKCLRVLDEQVEAHGRFSKFAVFYGAAHLPDLHQQLVERGWQYSEEVWMPAWVVQE